MGGTCPSCGRRGRPVGLDTVQSQVAISLRELAQPPYQFCATPDCAVVYYAAAVASQAPARGAITRDQLRERVFQKELAPDVLVCYCFGYTLGAMQQGDEAERAAILADIVAGTRQGQCACTLRNPQGGCCLGNVRRLMRVDVPTTASRLEEPE
jgi:hypothetical protein